ncbi:ABC transporter permease [Nesterenkonia muleiensis]|uniref:ABC transporter permease n=1 Tax=Nesterenkonia muleiensis TaxID=2282648 RepID=UPI000E7330A5|nr:ABC transporter permease [Nesterenkonia muleiensis]
MTAVANFSKSQSDDANALTGRLKKVLKTLLVQPGLLLASIVIVVILSWAIVPDVLAPYDPLRAETQDALQPPSLAHPFGTDEVGRDLFSRVVHGTGLSLLTTVVAVVIGLIGGSLLGAVAGYVGGALDTTIMRIIDVLLSIPLLLMAMALVTAIGFGPVQLSVAVGIALIGVTARVMRAETMRVSKSLFIDAERSVGASTGYILLRHILPNAMGPVLVLSIIEFGQAILTIAALSFLGFGTPPPTPEWGQLVASGQGYIASSWWMVTLPGLVIALFVVSVNRVAREFERRD